MFLDLESFVRVFLDAVSWNFCVFLGVLTDLFKSLLKPSMVNKDFENRHYIVDLILKKLYLIDLFRLFSKVLY